MRKRLFLGLGLPALLLLGGYLLLWLTIPPGYRITDENLERILPGMTEKEVERILGVPAGNYSGKRGYFASRPPDELERLLRQGHKEWVGEGLSIVVRFNEQGVVLNASRGANFGSSPSFLDRLRRWLGITS